jgi:hypothetical protein
VNEGFLLNGPHWGLCLIEPIDDSGLAIGVTKAICGVVGGVVKLNMA